MSETYEAHELSDNLWCFAVVMKDESGDEVRVWSLDTFLTSSDALLAAADPNRSNLFPEEV